MTTAGGPLQTELSFSGLFSKVSWCLMVPDHRSNTGAMRSRSIIEITKKQKHRIKPISMFNIHKTKNEILMWVSVHMVQARRANTGAIRPRSI